MRQYLYLLFLGICFYPCQNTFAEDTNSVALHLQIYNEGICLPLVPNQPGNTTPKNYPIQVFESGGYYRNFFVSIKSDTPTAFSPRVNHLLQAGVIQLKPNTNYEILLVRYHGFNNAQPDTMRIKVKELTNNAQVMLGFKQGTFSLNKIKSFKKLTKNTDSSFDRSDENQFENTLKIERTTHYANGNLKVRVYRLAENFPLKYVQEFDSLFPENYAQGYRMEVAQAGINRRLSSIWKTGDVTKYGYWEYFEEGKRIKLELWQTYPQKQFEWHKSGELKKETHFGAINKVDRHKEYTADGKVIIEFERSATAQQDGIMDCYLFTENGMLAMCNSYASSNGVTRKDLVKRVVYYPSGQPKMEERFEGGYTVKNYNEDGTEK
jgi:hypothetical protein